MVLVALGGPDQSIGTVEDGCGPVHRDSGRAVAGVGELAEVGDLHTHGRQEVGCPTRLDDRHPAVPQPALQQQHGFSLELRMGARHGRQTVFGALDEPGHLVGLETGHTDGVGLLFPGFEEGQPAGLRNGRGDRGQLLVDVCIAAGVDRDDQVRLERGDLVDLDTIGEAE
jgi:hypothetical protein